MDTNQRLFARVAPADERGCRLWTGKTDRDGYGVLRIAGRDHRVHRLAWELRHGPIPEGLLVCHRCDVRICVNAESHLFLGTHADNRADAIAKGRALTSGEHNGNAKLTDADVAGILVSPLSNRALARNFGVAHSIIAGIRSGTAWRHIPRPPA